MTTKAKPQPKLKPIDIEKAGPLDVAIIGGGPAGLTAAIYAARSGLKTAIIERALLGGMVSTTYLIENYPGFPSGISGQQLASILELQIQKLNVPTKWQEIEKIEDGKPYKKNYYSDTVIKSKTIIIASGSEAKKLKIKGEDKFRGMGVSYCAVCDGPFYKGKSIAVIGGGNSAIEEALYLTRFAEKVHVIHRRNKLRADKILADRAKQNPKIYFHWDSLPEEIKGQKMVEELVLKNTKTSKKTFLKMDGIFIYIGTSPNTKFIKGKIKLDKDGFIITDANMQTNIEGIFAAGDVRVKPLRQIVTAASDGAIAADSAYKFIENLPQKH